MQGVACRGQEMPRAGRAKDAVIPLDTKSNFDIYFDGFSPWLLSAIINSGLEPWQNNSGC